MGFLSKVWKGLKKGVKKIGKGIKKVFGKVMKAVGKLGIVGQIGMALLMPHMLGAIGGLFGTTGTLANWSTALIEKGGFFREMLGTALKGINAAGSFVKNAYTTVSSAISNGLDSMGNWLKGRGWTVTPEGGWENVVPGAESGAGAGADAVSRQGIKDFDVKSGNLKDGSWIDKNGMSISTKEYQSLIKGGGEGIKLNLNLQSSQPKFSNMMEAFQTDMDLFRKDPVAWFNQPKGPGITLNGKFTPFDSMNFGKTGTDTFNLFSNTTETLLSKPAKDPGFWEKINIFNPDSQIRADIRNFDAYDYARNEVSSSITEGFTGGLKQTVYEGIAGKPEYPDNYTVYTPNLLNIGNNPARSIYNSAATWDMRQGDMTSTIGRFATPLFHDMFNSSGRDRDYFNGFASYNMLGSPMSAGGLR